MVTIEGSNLGLKVDDVRGNVFIGDVPCHVHEYQVSVKITCRTGPAPIHHHHRSQQSGSSSSSTTSTTTTSPDLQFAVRVSTPAGSTRSTVKFTYRVSIEH